MLLQLPRHPRLEPTSSTNRTNCSTATATTPTATSTPNEKGCQPICRTTTIATATNWHGHDPRAQHGLLHAGLEL